MSLKSVRLSWLTGFYVVLLLCRRVHISQNTMDCLKGEFEVEPGDGGSRCDYLQEKGIVTYLIVITKEQLKNGINGVVSIPLGLCPALYGMVCPNRP